ncbi:MAG: DNA repair protein RecN [Saprospiraceae bacterium]|nr:DNA repair protein RecN [Pyrinomonadaceae bacterium]
MLSLLKIKNIALIDSLEIEFGNGLNLLTGETGSGKSIIVDSLGALTGDRVSSDLIKEGENAARIEGLFSVRTNKTLQEICDESGVEIDDAVEIEMIVRRELSLSGKNRIFVNNQLVTQSFLKSISVFLVDIHGQGEHAALFNPASHLEMLDEYAKLKDLRQKVSEAHRHWSVTKTELGMLEKNEAEKLQLLDILRFQVAEIKKFQLEPGDEEKLEEEKKLLNNVEKLSSLSEDAYSLLYENTESTVATLEKALRKIEELAQYDMKFDEYLEGLKSAQALIEDLSYTTRDFRSHLEFSPERLEEIERRLAEISRLTRKYGGTVESVLAHLHESEERLENIETAELREAELNAKVKMLRSEYVKVASELHGERVRAAVKFADEIEGNLKAVALEKARFEIRVDAPEKDQLESEGSSVGFTAKGFDRVEYYFSANVGESPKPLAKVASGGEASRLMLILKTTAKTHEREKTAVFDEIDAGIGGRVAEAVGLKLKELANTQQVLCVTHQPQVASKADRHFVVEKAVLKDRTSIGVRELNAAEQVEEVARMLAGERITDAARENAREMLSAVNRS